MKWTLIVLGGFIGLVLLASLALYPIGMKKLTRSYPGIPVENVNIPTAPDAVARGRHISIVWSCAKCHGENLSGTVLADDPFLGTISAANLTSGKGGIAKSYTDVDWIRAIRHGIRPDSQVEIFMYEYFSTMSDQDLGALIAYLKQIPPVDSVNPEMHFGPLLAVAPAVGLFSPMAELIDHQAPRVADPQPGPTKEYGKYLSPICIECHGTYVAGKLEKWTQAEFIRALQTGVKPDGKQLGQTMSSKNFSEMNAEELAALWRYFVGAQP